MKRQLVAEQNKVSALVQLGNQVLQEVGPILTFQNEREFDRADGPTIEEITVTSPSKFPPSAVDLNQNDSEGGIGRRNRKEGGIGSKTKMNVLVPFNKLRMETATKDHTRVHRPTKLCATRRKKTGTPRQKPAFYEETSAKLCVDFSLPTIPLQPSAIPIAIRLALLNLNFIKSSKRQGPSKSSYKVPNISNSTQNEQEMEMDQDTASCLDETGELGCDCTEGALECISA